MRFKDNSTLILNKVSENSKRAIRAAGNRAVEMVKEKILYGYNEPHGNDGHTEIVDTGALYLGKNRMYASLLQSAAI